MSDQEPTVIRKFPAARGLAWVSGSWGLVKRQPLRLLLISLFFQFLLSFSQMGALGLVIILCLPVLSAGLLHAFFLVEQGEKPMLAVLFMPFTVKQTIGSLLLLGGVAMVLALVVVTLVMAGQMLDIDPEIIIRIEKGDLDALQLIDPQLLETAVLSMALGAAISGTITYFSVPLIWFRKQKTGSAVIMGLKGLGRNWKPLLVIGLLLGILAVPIVLLFGSFYLSALSEGTASTLLGFLLLMIGPMFQLLLFGTQYLAFRDIFGLDEAATGSTSQSGDQLVA
ncbi:MAG: BPSS1780 family membrane protein [Xanthomonadales bacterium]|nr:BPSS1780 family membrane protein [Xanthomonadales bacterium]MDH4019132.1 BPSS1780 family membrane protein [Xanthomonadales bacterium]